MVGLSLQLQELIMKVMLFGKMILLNGMKALRNNVNKHLLMIYLAAFSMFSGKVKQSL
jgi:hypothetical protein